MTDHTPDETPRRREDIEQAVEDIWFDDGLLVAPAGWRGDRGHDDGHNGNQDDVATTDTGDSDADEESGDRVVVDQADINSRIAQLLEIPLTTVNAVINVEIEYQVGTGICEDPEWEFRFWEPATLAGREPAIDEYELALAAEEFLDVPVDTALAIYAAELDELVRAGVVVTPDDDFDPDFDDEPGDDDS